MIDLNLVFKAYLQPFLWILLKKLAHSHQEGEPPRQAGPVRKCTADRRCEKWFHESCLKATVLWPQVSTVPSNYLLKCTVTTKTWKPLWQGLPWVLPNSHRPLASGQLRKKITLFSFSGIAQRGWKRCTGSICSCKFNRWLVYVETPLDCGVNWVRTPVPVIWKRHTFQEMHYVQLPSPLPPLPAPS